VRKRIINPALNTPPASPTWLNIENIATVEITSEEAAYPIELAFLPGTHAGWRAATPGKQLIRLLFDQPQPLQQIWLKFLETQIERTQEFVLQWSSDGQTFQEIVRQQWNFSPDGAVDETEAYDVQLDAVTVLALSITPDIRGGTALASLAQLRLA